MNPQWKLVLLVVLAGVIGIGIIGVLFLYSGPVYITDSSYFLFGDYESLLFATLSGRVASGTNYGTRVSGLPTGSGSRSRSR